MAEGETAGLDILIKQRHSRPSYARMISWEIEKTSSLPPKPRTSSRHVKSQIKHERITSSNDTGEGEVKTEEGGGEEDVQGGEELIELLESSSEDSEYFSTEENLDFCDSDVLDDNDAEEKDDTHGDGFPVSKQMKNVSLPANSRQRKRAPSKKQKKKRRRQQEDTSVLRYDEFKVPFRNVENITFSVKDLQGDLVSETPDTMAEVPSLMQLSIQALQSSNRQSKLGYRLLPGPVRRAVSSWRQQQAFTSLQLSGLYHILAMLECKKLCKDDCDWATRNMWSILACNNPDRGFPSGDHFIGSEVTMVIPFTYSGCASADFWKKMCGTYRSHAYFTSNITSLLVSVLDLMLPVYEQPIHKKGRKPVPEEKNDAALIASVTAAMNQLKKRYPDVIQLTKERALPYLYWLRGHSKLALHKFLELADSSSSLKERVAYLYEAARMCRLQNQGEAARRLFRQAHDLLLDTPAARGSNLVRGEITTQLLMLYANTFDHGLMSEQRAAESLAAWRLLTTMSLPVQPVESLLSVVESLLCFHLAHLPGQTVQDKLEGITELAELAAQQCRTVGSTAALHLHLSLVYAWLGWQEDSVTAFQRIGVFAVDDSHGAQFMPQNMRRSEYTPWQPILDVTTTSGGTSLNSLQVVWRTHIGHPRLIRDLNVYEGDLCGRSLNLRLSPEGHLTGDLHLLLPPVRAFNLDLHSGHLVMPSTPGQTYINKSFLNSRFYLTEQGSVEYPNGSCAVTPTELYSDQDGRTVHLFAAGATRILEVENLAEQIHWSNGRGQRCKINLFNALKTLVKKKVETEIHRSYKTLLSQNRSGKEQVSLTKQMILEGLEFLFKHDFQMSAHEAVCAGRDLEKMKAQTEKCSSRGPKKQHELAYLKSMSNTRKFSYQLWDFVVYGHTLCIAGTFGVNFDFALFFDVTNKESFQKPVLHHTPITKHTHWIDMQFFGQKGNCIPRSNILCWRPALESPKSFFGQGGEILINASEVASENPDGYCFLGTSVYGLKRHHDSGAAGDLPVLHLCTLDAQKHRFEVTFHDLGLNLQEIKVLVDKLLLICSDGLRVLCPQNLQFQPVLRGPDSECQLPLSDDGLTLLVEAQTVDILEEKKVTTPAGQPTILVGVSIDNYLLVLSVQESDAVPFPMVEMAFCVKIAGRATEICFVSEKVGWLVSTTMHKKTDLYYRETVYHLSPSGKLLGVLPILGPGPRDFLPHFLYPVGHSGNDELPASDTAAVWHVYMRDGYEGIMAVRL